MGVKMNTFHTAYVAYCIFGARQIMVTEKDHEIRYGSILAVTLKMHLVMVWSGSYAVRLDKLNEIDVIFDDVYYF